MIGLVMLAAAALSDASVKAHAFRCGLTAAQIEVSSEQGHFSVWMSSYGQPHDLDYKAVACFKRWAKRVGVTADETVADPPPPVLHQ